MKLASGLLVGICVGAIGTVLYHRFFAPLREEEIGELKQRLAERITELEERIEFLPAT